MIVFQMIIEERDNGDIEFHGSLLPFKVPPTEQEQEIANLVGGAMNWVAEEVVRITGHKPIVDKPYESK